MLIVVLTLTKLTMCIRLGEKPLFKLTVFHLLLLSIKQKRDTKRRSNDEKSLRSLWGSIHRLKI